jgi:hypothetical protein
MISIVIELRGSRCPIRCDDASADGENDLYELCT